MWRVAGQENALRVLSRAVKEGSLSHAYLFCGPKGVGKTAAARELAAAINCLGEYPPCWECRSCQRVEGGLHADVQVVGEDPSQSGTSGEIGIDAAKELQRWAGLLPFEGAYRAFVVVECERLTLEAANSLLKVLEESPPHVVFILTSNSEEALLPTIRSRCQRVPFRRLSLFQVEALLTERHGLPPEEARKLAGLSHGRPGWAVSVMGQPDLLARREQWMKEMEELGHGGLLSRYAYAARLARAFPEDRSGVYEALDLMVEWWREALLHSIGANSKADEEMSTGSGEGFGARSAEFRGFISRIVETKRLLGENVNPQLALEALMSEMPQLREAA